MKKSWAPWARLLSMICGGCRDCKNHYRCRFGEEQRKRQKAESAAIELSKKVDSPRSVRTFALEWLLENVSALESSRAQEIQEELKKRNYAARLFKEYEMWRGRLLKEFPVGRYGPNNISSYEIMRKAWEQAENCLAFSDALEGAMEEKKESRNV